MKTRLVPEPVQVPAALVHFLTRPSVDERSTPRDQRRPLARLTMAEPAAAPDLRVGFQLANYWRSVYSTATEFAALSAAFPLRKKGHMDERILELAVEALENRRAEVELEIEALQIILKGGATAKRLGTVAPAGVKRRPRTAAEKRAQSRLMKKIWARKRAEAANTKSAKRATPAKPKRGSRSAAARRAQSLKMKAYWAKRRADAAAKTKK